MQRLNARAATLCSQLVQRATPGRLVVVRDESGARIVDAGVHVTGNLAAGLEVARISAAGGLEVDLVPDRHDLSGGLAVQVWTDQPVEACLGAQYAGWQVVGEKYFAMGSGPMRALRGREPLLESLGIHETAELAVGVLESAAIPPADVCLHLAAQCGVDVEQLTLLVAPTASLVGTIQVVARSVETALHKLHELNFDVRRIVSGCGVAPLPPPAADDLRGIGRTNDAILYGGAVTLWVDAPDEELVDVGSSVPAEASADYGRPFLEIFERVGRDFYKIDPLLFSPAQVTLISLRTGQAHRFGSFRADLLRTSFAN